MPWSSWSEFGKALLEGAATDTVLLLATGALGFLLAWWRQRRVVPRVDIQVRKVTPVPSARVQPKVLVATFSGYRRPGDMPEEEFIEALQAADLERLPLDETTPGIGTTIKLLGSYSSLEKVFLLTTRTKEGISSIDAVPLLRAWAKRAGLTCQIVAEEGHCLDLEEDSQVTRDAFDATHGIFKSLGRRRYKPKGSQVLVDVTGGPHAMSIGALLACLGPHQDAHVIGSRYDDAGGPIKGSAFPMLIQFQPRGTK